MKKKYVASEINGETELVKITDQEYIDFVASAEEKTEWLFNVCNGKNARYHILDVMTIYGDRKAYEGLFYVNLLQEVDSIDDIVPVHNDMLKKTFKKHKEYKKFISEMEILKGRGGCEYIALCTKIIFIKYDLKRRV